jgi:uncharacterized protein with HEPN domain
MKDERLYLDHILERIERIEEFTQDGRDALMRSKLIQDAVLRNFEIIGEASRKISVELRQRYPDVPWQRMADFRNVLIHDYDNVNLTLVWRVIENELPVLKPRIKEIIRKLDEEMSE